MIGWTDHDAPDQSGKVMVVTGANSGIGLAVTQQLAAKNATVVMACRNEKKADEAAALIRKATPNAKLEVMVLDVSSLASVRTFATALRERHPRIDVLINNAGVMALPYGKTVDGFELQLGTNHLGPFALTALLLPALEQTDAPRVVNVSSNMHHLGRLDFDDLQSEKRYRKWPTYGATKLANLLFTYELERRLRAAHKKTIVVACHPGYASTNLVVAGPTMEKATLVATFFKYAGELFAQSAEEGAWPTLFAATEPSVKGGDYVGPSGPFSLFGTPTLVESNAAANDPTLAARLWQVSEHLTSTHFDLPVQT